MDWVNAWALAVNEENACRWGAWSTAPTNGRRAGHRCPAVLHFYERFEPGGERRRHHSFFLLTAGCDGDAL